MFEFVNTLLIGITAGSIYSLMAIAIVLVWVEFFAPEGYEDHNGFHLGRDPRVDS